jgi:hypothetical protein
MEESEAVDSFFDLSPWTILKALGAALRLARSEEAADADDVGFDLAVLVEQDVADVADLLLSAPITSVPLNFDARTGPAAAS